MLTKEEHSKLLHDLADVANTLRKLKLNVAELVQELDATANDIKNLTEKIK